MIHIRSHFRELVDDEVKNKCTKCKVKFFFSLQYIPAIGEQLEDEQKKKYEGRVYSAGKNIIEIKPFLGL